MSLKIDRSVTRPAGQQTIQILNGVPKTSNEVDLCGANYVKELKTKKESPTFVSINTDTPNLHHHTLPTLPYPIPHHTIPYHTIHIYINMNP